ncbi:MAG TPA: hypothetical protein PLJ27_26915, partial [Polyangiaceae bacterium]|nr:hypothetical protein [Polyangiaceae bacterium]
MLGACSAPSVRPQPPSAAPAAPVAPASLPKAPSLELVESWPSETSLDDPLIRDAAVAWVDLIDSAR